MEQPAREGESPVSEARADPAGSRVPRDTGNPVGTSREPETLCLQAVEVLLKYDRVLFVERSGELRVLARLSTSGAEPQGNQVLRGRFSQYVQARNRVTYPCPG